SRGYEEQPVVVAPPGYGVGTGGEPGPLHRKARVILPPRSGTDHFRGGATILLPRIPVQGVVAVERLAEDLTEELPVRSVFDHRNVVEIDRAVETAARDRDRHGGARIRVVYKDRPAVIDLPVARAGDQCIAGDATSGEDRRFGGGHDDCGIRI